MISKHYNLKPIELQAAIGLVQMKKLPEINTLRKLNHSRLTQIFHKFEEHFLLPKATDWADPSWFAFALTIKDNAPFKRKDIVHFLEDKKIQTRPYFAGNIMLQPAYAGIIPQEDVIKNYPIARKVTTDTFFLGTSPVISNQQLNYVEEVVNEFFKTI